MNNNMQGISGGILVLILVALLGYGFWTGMEKTEVVECLTWRSQSTEFKPTFYLLEWQKQQCDSHGIEIDAPVKKSSE